MTDRTRCGTAHTIKTSIHWFWAVAALLALSGLVACSPAEPLSEQGPSTATEPPATSTPTKEEPVTDTPTIPMPKDPYLQRMVTLAQEDLASRLAVEIDQIELLALEEVTWSDTSMGCPQPGMRYRQVPQDGLLIQLSAGGRAYDYHSGANRDPFLCEQTAGTPKSKRPAPIDLVPPPGGEDD